MVQKINVPGASPAPWPSDFFSFLLTHKAEIVAMSVIHSMICKWHIELLRDAVMLRTNIRTYLASKRGAVVVGMNGQDYLHSFHSGLRHMNHSFSHRLGN